MYVLRVWVCVCMSTGVYVYIYVCMSVCVYISKVQIERYIIVSKIAIFCKYTCIHAYSNTHTRTFNALPPKSKTSKFTLSKSNPRSATVWWG